MIERFPHCDQRILHAPGECEFCGLHPEWQELREAWGIAFTGHWPGLYAKHGDIEELQLPCPADYARPQGSDSDHRAWGGNTAKPAGAQRIGVDYAGYELTADDPRIAQPQTFGKRVRKRLGI